MFSIMVPESACMSLLKLCKRVKSLLMSQMGALSLCTFFKKDFYLTIVQLI